MSVFQLKDWWSARQEGEFDCDSMVLANLDNASPPADKLAVASLAGLLRVYLPLRAGFRVEDLVLEQSLDAPVLALLVGRFVPASDMLALAVLHPRTLVVYELVAHGAQGARASYYELERLYAHELGLGGRHFTASAMVCGAFGGVRDRDLLLVHSMDGKLQIFEGPAVAFSGQMSDCLLPGPLAYVPRIDAFVVARHTCRLECVRYQVLLSAHASEEGEGKGEGKDRGEERLSAVRPAMMEWTVNLGECVRRVALGRFTQRSERADELLVLGERSVFLLKDSGALLRQMRLEREPLSMHAYAAGSSKNFLLAFADGALHVYRDFGLVWAATVSRPPVQLIVCALGECKGLVATLSDDGLLGVGYLGTRPPLQAT